jgi:hypothetical protein
LGESGKGAEIEKFQRITYGKEGVLEGMDLDKTGALLVGEDKGCIRYDFPGFPGLQWRHPLAN